MHSTRTASDSAHDRGSREDQLSTSDLQRHDKFLRGHARSGHLVNSHSYLRLAVLSAHANWRSGRMSF